ncbi:ral guanine nucleotide dissociation stimulator-like 2 isoform X2 [Amia ocellicauda]|uniref:ral guanine nucleotide dissociation stimulator-like 2 isoform X2 n=1 Tax=Amia ocellicauda TaxID=2972642 RepID=UPI003464AD8B
MLPRGWRGGGLALPEEGVTLSAFRPLQAGGEGGVTDGQMDTHTVSLSPDLGAMKTTWYCPLELPAEVSELEEEGVLYSVVTRQQHSATTCPGPSLSHSRCVKGGTVEGLVLHLLSCSSLGDSSFLPTFLSTYRSFTTPETVLSILTHRLELPPVVTQRRSTEERLEFNMAVCSVFSAWLSGYPEDFLSLSDPSPLLHLTSLLPSDPRGQEVKTRLLMIAEELSERDLLSPSPCDSDSDLSMNSLSDPVTSDFDVTTVLGFPAELIAEQLTMIETELFVKVVPYQCLGSLWSRRDKQRGVCPSVRATVHQFNTLANAVTASCLLHTGLRGQQRARLLEKWISVAEECRARKNFSSLYAIISALQSNPLHRLRRTWAETDREAVQSYEELCQIFSEKDNYSQSRELLKEEGTSKFANLETKRHKRRTGSVAQGTVPYLGTFLTDLTMLDTAVKDRLENGYINFDKRRREFDVLAQIQLLQSSCKNCSFKADHGFLQWYHSVPALGKEQSYQFSCQIEPGDFGTPSKTVKPTLVISHCADMLCSVASPGFEGDGSGDYPSPVNHLLIRLAKHMKSPSVSCLDVDSSPPASDPPTSMLAPPPSFVKSHRRSASCGTTSPPVAAKGAGPDIRIVRIRMELQDGNMYRSILVTSNDKTPSVVSTALEKHSQDPSQAPKYELVQLLPDGKELTMPATGNVFYAMTSSSVDFLLRRRGQAAHTSLYPINSENSATFPRIKAKGRKFVRALF